jgi:uncharacterized membrane protein YqjE
LIATLRRLASTALALLQTRLELFATELDEERARVLQLLALCVIAGCFLLLGIVTLTVFIVLLAGDAHRVLAAGLLSAVYLGIGIAVGLRARRLVQVRPRLFSATLGELQKDRDTLA